MDLKNFFKIIGPIRSIQLCLLLIIVLLLLISFLQIIFDFGNYKESFYYGSWLVLFSFTVLLQSVSTISKEELIIPDPLLGGGGAVANLKGHKKAKYFFAVLIFVIGLIILYTGIVTFSIKL